MNQLSNTSLQKQQEQSVVLKCSVSESLYIILIIKISCYMLYGLSS